MRAQEIYAAMVRLQLVQSQLEFSRVWLGRSARYYSSIIARRQQPGLGTIYALLFRLRNTVLCMRETSTRSALVVLIQQLDGHLALRMASSNLR